MQPDLIGTKGATWCHRKTSDKEIYFVAAGRVDNMVEIVVNGTSVTTLWSRPFRTDITEQLNPGENQIEV